MEGLEDLKWYSFVWKSDLEMEAREDEENEDWEMEMK